MMHRGDGGGDDRGRRSLEGLMEGKGAVAAAAAVLLRRP